MEETVYSELPLQEVLAKSLQQDEYGQADPNAVQELINRQRMGTALRLYDGPRQGPYDEGLVPLAMHNQSGMVVIEVGAPGKSFVIPKEELGRWLQSVADKYHTIVNDLRGRGWEQDRINRWFDHQATPDFNVAATAVMNSDCQEGMGISLYPETENHWAMGWGECALFCRVVIAAMDDARWTNQDIGLTASGRLSIIRLIN